MGLNTSVSSGPLTTNTLLFNGKNYIKGVLVGVGATATLYDGLTAAGRVVYEVDNTAGTAPIFTDFSHMVQCPSGLFAEVSGGTVFVYYG